MVGKLKLRNIMYVFGCYKPFRPRLAFKTEIMCMRASYNEKYETFFCVSKSR
jgi:hypothetical protein